jgi:hypothetical protein
MNKRGSIPLWLVFLILGLIVLTLLIVMNSKVFGGIMDLFDKIGGGV